MNIFQYKSKTPEFTGQPTLMPLKFRIFSWLVVIVIFMITAWVWLLAWQLKTIDDTGAWVPTNQFAMIFLGYHIIMLFVSFVGWFMQTYWHRDEILVLFPLALVIGTISLLLAAVQLTFLVDMV